MQYGRKGFWRLADKWRSGHDVKTVSHFDRFVVLTEEDRTYWGNMPNIRVIPNARTYSCTAPAKLDNKTVLAVGRYNHQKGFERLIEAWGIVCREVPGWQLEIIGDGELRPQMVEQINSLGMQGSIVLKKVPGNQMRETYASASIFVLSSRYEGLPMVLLEAQASGLPIVSFACKCGPRDVIDHGVSGFLVDEGDVETLAARIIQLAKDEELRQRMGLAAHANSNHFSEETIMNRWVELFESL